MTFLESVFFITICTLSDEATPFCGIQATWTGVVQSKRGLEFVLCMLFFQVIITGVVLVLERLLLKGNLRRRLYTLSPTPTTPAPRHPPHGTLRTA